MMLIPRLVNLICQPPAANGGKGYPSVKFTSNKGALFAFYNGEVIVRKMDSCMSLRRHGRSKKD